MPPPRDVYASLRIPEFHYWLGGVVTLLVVGVTALLAPQLRTLNLAAQQHPVEE